MIHPTDSPMWGRISKEAQIKILTIWEDIHNPPIDHDDHDELLSRGEAEYLER
jgi:hypothetical protein